MTVVNKVLKAIITMLLLPIVLIVYLVLFGISAIEDWARGRV